MVDRPVKSATKSFKAPYPPSWIDRLIVWIDRLPGPAWLFYLASAVLFALLFTATLWIDGSLPFGTLDLNTTSFAVFVMYWTALYQFLTRIGAQSLEAFRPLLVADDIEFARINYELANLPRQAGWLSIVIGIAFAVVTVSSEPSTYGEISPQTALVRAVDLATTMFLSITFF
jgi:hypothetical protein